VYWLERHPIRLPAYRLILPILKRTKDSTAEDAARGRPDLSGQILKNTAFFKLFTAIEQFVPSD
jgi:hypothetical protein